MYQRFLLLLSLGLVEIAKVPVDKHVGLDMVTARGYTIQTHYVTTDDGHILNPARNSRYSPVLLQWFIG